MTDTRDELREELKKTHSLLQVGTVVTHPVWMIDDIAKYYDWLNTYTQAKVLEAKIAGLREVFEPLENGYIFKMSANRAIPYIRELEAELEDRLTPRERMEKYEAERSKFNHTRV